MGKDITSLPEVWVVTGFSYHSDGKVVLAVCPTEQDARNAKIYHEKYYDEVDYECFSQETYAPMPIYYGGIFTAEVRPYKDGTYLLGQVRITQTQHSVDEGINPKDYESITFTLTNKIDNTGHESYSLSGTFISAEEVPIKDGVNVGGAAREWLMNKVNEKGVIKLTIPNFDE